MNPTQTESAAAAAGALYRLPTTVVPEHYAIVLTPDLEKFVFSGAETVRVKVQESTNVLILNANELELLEATVTGADGKTLQGSTELDKEHEFARITFAQQLGVGTWALDIKFTGELNDKLNGFYRSHYTHPTLGLRPMATTQFETTDARKAFPCFDEPAMKATFSITAVIPAELEAISNGAVESVESFDEIVAKTAGEETSIPDATGDSRPDTSGCHHYAEDEEGRLQRDRPHVHVSGGSVRRRLRAFGGCHLLWYRPPHLGYPG
jgi:aminopeptidase N